MPPSSPTANGTVVLLDEDYISRHSASICSMSVYMHMFTQNSFASDPGTGHVSKRFSITAKLPSSILTTEMYVMSSYKFLKSASQRFSFFSEMLALSFLLFIISDSFRNSEFWRLLILINAILHFYIQRETVESTRLASLPAAYNALSAQAQEYALACITLPKDVSTMPP